MFNQSVICLYKDKKKYTYVKKNDQIVWQNTNQAQVNA